MCWSFFFVPHIKVHSFPWWHFDWPCWSSSGSKFQSLLKNVGGFIPICISVFRDFEIPLEGVGRQTWMCHSNGSLFYKKSLNMGPILKKKKNSKTWVQFSDWAQIFGFSHGKNPQSCKICGKWAYFSRKPLTMGTFSAKMTLKDG